MVDFGPTQLFESTTSVNEDENSLTIDASGEKIGWVFMAPKSGDIRKVSFRTGVVTTGDTLLVSFQDVDLATGQPDETADQSVTQVVGSGDDDTVFQVTMGSDRTVTAGDYMTVVLEYNSYVAGSMAIVHGSGQLSINNYATLKTTGSWAVKTRNPTFSLEYSDGSVSPIVDFLSGAGLPVNTDFNNTSSPDHIGIKFKVAAPVRVSGFSFTGRFAGNIDVKLYDSDGTTVLLSKSLDSDVATSDATFHVSGVFDGTAVLTKDTFYRIVLEPTTATNIRLVGVEELADTAGFPGGANVHKTSKKDAGWTDDTTTRYYLVPIIDQIDDGTGGGAASTTSYGFVN